MDRRVQDDGTVIVGGQVVPTGGAQPTIASVVSYDGNSGLQSTNVEGALDELDNEKAPITHTHDDRYFTEVEVTNLLAGKAASNHTHDDRYFTEIEVTDLINTHIHDDRYYTEAEVDALINEALGSISEHANPSFETLAPSNQGNQNTGAVATRDMPEGWDCGWNFPITSLSYPRMSVETGNTYSPGHAYRVDFDGNYNTHQYVWSPGFACPEGSVVTVELMVYTSASHIKVDLGILTGNTPSPNVFTSGYDIQSNGFYSSVGVWTKQKASFVVKAGHSYGRLQFRVNNDGVGAGYALIDDTRSSVQIVPPSSVVTGEIKMWPTASAPAGYLLCNGGTFDSGTYPALAALLGDTFGTHSGTTYYLPDFRGRSPIGGGAAVPSDGSGYSYPIGYKHGTGKHTLTQGQLPYVEGTMQAHSSFSHWWSPTGALAGSTMTSTYGAPGATGSAGSINIFKFAFGNNEAHNIVHPVLGINFIIKAA